MKFGEVLFLVVMVMGGGVGGTVNLVNLFLSESDLLRPKIDPLDPPEGREDHYSGDE